MLSYLSRSLLRPLLSSKPIQAYATQTWTSRRTLFVKKQNEDPNKNGGFTGQLWGDIVKTAQEALPATGPLSPAERWLKNHELWMRNLRSGAVPACGTPSSGMCFVS